MNLMDRLRSSMGIRGWDLCVLWKLSEDQRFLEWMDCCCYGIENAQNSEHVHPFAMPMDSGIHAQTMKSNQPQWLNISSCSDSPVLEEIGTRVLIPVPGGVFELFTAQQVPKDEHVIKCIASQCDISMTNLSKNDQVLIEDMTNALTTMSLQGNAKDSTKHDMGKSDLISDGKAKRLDAEIKRRKLLNDRLFALRALVPIRSTVDRASILEDAIEHVKNLQKQAKELRDELEDHIEGQVEVVELGGNELFVKVICEHRKGGFLKLMEGLNSLGFEVANANVTTFNTFVSNVFTLEKRDNETIEVDNTRKALIELTRNLSGVEKYARSDSVLSRSNLEGHHDGFMWYNDIGKHWHGEFSIAIVQANKLLEDQSQIESGSLSTHNDFGPYGTFVGIYDGHGGPETSCYVNDHIFSHLKNFIFERQSISVDVIRKTFQTTEEGFLSLVTKQWPTKPPMAAVGTCCLIGIICSGTLYIANVGDSRAVLGTIVNATGEVMSVQLSVDHNVAIKSVRQEFRSLHPDDPEIVVLKNKVWRVKGIIQISRSIGDAYLKKAEFNKKPLHEKFRLSEPFKMPILSADPSILEHELQPNDRFIIFASDGLWDHLSNQEAVDIVQNNPHNGSARRLVKAALKHVAKRRKMRYSELKKIERGLCRSFHDDITVVVLFLDSNLVSNITSEVM